MSDSEPARRRAPLCGVSRMVKIGIGASVALIAGVLLGAQAIESIKPQPMAFEPSAPVARPAEAVDFDTSEALSGRNWARSAYLSGLRDCPETSPAFHSACTDQMSLEAKRPPPAPMPVAEHRAASDYGLDDPPLRRTEYGEPTVFVDAPPPAAHDGAGLHAY